MAVHLPPELAEVIAEFACGLMALGTVRPRAEEPRRVVKPVPVVDPDEVTEVRRRVATPQR